MGVRDMFSRKESAFAGAIVSQWATGQAVWTSDRYEDMAREGYGHNPIVFGCIDRLARGAAGVPRVLYQTSHARERKAIARHLAPMPAVARAGEIKTMLRKNDLGRVDSHKLLDLLDHPNPLYNGARLTEALIAYYCLAGNAYQESVSAGDGPPRELYAHRPDRTSVVVGTAAEPVSHYEYRVGGATRRIEADTMLHLKTFNPLDDWYGMPPLKAASRSTDANNGARAWNAALVQNSARPSGLLKVSGAKAANSASIAKFIEYLKDRWIGSSNAGRPGVLAVPEGTDVEWIQTAFTAVEASWLEGMNLSAREICTVFDMPSILLGDTSAMSFKNYPEARKALYIEGIFPRLDMLFAAWNSSLVPNFGDNLLLAYDADQVDAIQEDREKQHKRAREDFRAGLIRLNEAREELGYEADAEYGEKYAFEIPGAGGNPDKTGDGEAAA